MSSVVMYKYDPKANLGSTEETRRWVWTKAYLMTTMISIPGEGEEDEEGEGEEKKKRGEEKKKRGEGKKKREEEKEEMKERKNR